MKYFPSVENYNMDTCSGRSLYLAHCDFDPLQGLIDQTKISTQATVEYFGQLAHEATEHGDMRTACEASDTQGIFAARVIPLAYESILLIMVSRLEEAMNTWCRSIHIRDPACPELKDYSARGGVIEKAAAYLKEYAHIDGIKQNSQWEYVTAIRDSRNMVVHNGGRVKEDYREKLVRFNIGMREEDFSVYVDHDTILNMYRAIVEFMDQVFHLEDNNAGGDD
jgi:hypothetical protein